MTPSQVGVFAESSKSESSKIMGLTTNQHGQDNSSENQDFGLIKSILQASGAIILLRQTSLLRCLLSSSTLTFRVGHLSSFMIYANQLASSLVTIPSIYQLVESWNRYSVHSRPQSLRRNFAPQDSAALRENRLC